MSHNPRYYIPDEITEDYIEDIADDLRLAMFDLLENGPNEEDSVRSVEILKHLNDLIEILSSEEMMGEA